MISNTTDRTNITTDRTNTTTDRTNNTTDRTNTTTDGTSDDAGSPCSPAHPIAYRWKGKKKGKEGIRPQGVEQASPTERPRRVGVPDVAYLGEGGSYG